MSYTRIPVDDLIDRLDADGEAVIHMIGGDYHLPGPPGYEWVMRAMVGEVRLEHASTVTTDNLGG